jgi:hypothetical protein
VCRLLVNVVLGGCRRLRRLHSAGLDAMPMVTLENHHWWLRLWNEVGIEPSLRPPLPGEVTGCIRSDVCSCKISAGAKQKSIHLHLGQPSLCAKSKSNRTAYANLSTPLRVQTFTCRFTHSVFRMQ